MADGSGLRQQLNGRLAAAGRSLWLPAFIKAWGAPLLWTAAFAVFWLTGLAGRLPAESQAIVGIVFWGGLAFLLSRGGKAWSPPTREDAAELIDTAIEGRPMSTWGDRPARNDRDAWRLWEAHRDRMAKLALGVRRFELAALWERTDPWRTRFVAPIVVAAAALLAGGAGLERLQRGLVPDIGALFGAHKVSVQAWVSPPTYTGAAPFVLDPGADARAPEGSEVTLRILSPGRPTVRMTPDQGRARTLRPEIGVDGAYEARLIIAEPQDLAVHYWGKRVEFTFYIIDDAAPKAEFVSPPKLGEADRTEFQYKVSDDFGVTKLELVARLAKPPAGAEAIEEAVPVPLAALDPKEESGAFAEDLVRHRWAGLDVMVRLRATDGAGGTGESAEVAYKFPEKILLQPIARAAQEARATLLREWRPYAEPAEDDRFTALPEGDDLSGFATAAASRLQLAPEGVQKAAAMLEAMIYGAEDYIEDPVVFLGLSHAKAMIESAQDKERAEAAEVVLWDVALRAEYGSVADAKAALEAARRALEEAIRRGASPEEIKRLMDMYEAAVENYLAAQMAEAIREGRFSESQGGSPQAGGGPSLGDDEMQAMLDRLRELAEGGDAEAARQLLAEMQRMLEQYENAELQMSQGGGSGEQQDGPLSRALNRALQETNRAMNEQRDLNDLTEDAMRRDEGDIQRGQELADRQRELRERLEQQMRSGGGQPGDQQRGQEGEQGQGGQGQQGEGEGSRRGERGDPQGPGGNRDGQGRQFGDNGQLPGPDRGEPGAPGGARPGQETERSRRLLGRALEAQRRAEEALRRGDFEGARAAQREAMAALQDRSGELARLADGNDPNARAERDQRDVLGRLNSGSSGFGDDVEVPDEIERQRARDILDEIRRRAGDRTLRQEELEYLLRLLDRF